MYIKKLLNQKAKELMANTPQNVQKQTDAFIKAVSEAVNSYITEADKKVEAAKARSVNIIQDEQGEKYFLKDFKIGAAGLHLSIHRKTFPLKPVTCIRYQFEFGSPRYCSANCAGFQILDSGNVKLCDGDERNIVKE